MSIAARITTPAILHPASTGGRDDDSGDVTAGFGPDRHVYVEAQQQQTRENRNGGLVVSSEWVALFRPPGTPFGVDVLTASDEVSIDGLGRFAFEGDPYLVLARRRPSHWFVRLRKVG